jgi:4-hydroxy-3-methylbut-2-enyl diphosphate reductase
MCFGVRDAIALALEHADAGPLTILGDLVHNPAVLAALRAKGIAIAADVTTVQTPTVMVTAHGASERTLTSTRARGLQVVEATCPLVHVAHRAIKALLRDGYHPVIIGQRAHVEVRGMTEDLANFDVVLSEEDVQNLAGHPRMGIAAQTTQPVERVQHLVGLIRRRFPASEVRFIDTVCQPTKQRQIAAVELAQRCDVVLVVGGANSNNTRELVNTCGRHCPHVHHIETASDLRDEWFVGATTVGITAGTSTPDAVIDEVEQALARVDSHSRRPSAGHAKCAFEGQPHLADEAIVEQPTDDRDPVRYAPRRRELRQRVGRVGSPVAASLRHVDKARADRE